MLCMMNTADFLTMKRRMHSLNVFMILLRQTCALKVLMLAWNPELADVAIVLISKSRQIDRFLRLQHAVLANSQSSNSHPKIFSLSYHDMIHGYLICDDGWLSNRCQRELKRSI